MKNSIKTLLFILSMALVLPLSAQKGTSVAYIKDQICKKWNYSKCRILGIEYTSNENEEGDMIHFGRDMSYTLIEHGKTQVGTWAVAPGNNKIQLYKGEKLIKELIVDKLTSSEFIYTITMSQQYEVSMFMTSEMLN